MAPRQLLAALSLIACSPFAGAGRPWRAVRPEIAAWIDAHAIALPDAGDRLTAAACDALPTGGIIGLGESSHGVHELRAAQLAIVQCLAARPGPVTLLFEASYHWTAELDRHVLGGARPDLGSGLLGTRPARGLHPIV